MKRILFLLALSLFGFQLNSFADISIQNSTGIVKIVPAGGGAPITINPGQPVPPIADGSTIEILTGSVTVTTTAPSTVNISTNGNTISLPPGTTVKVSLNTNGAIRVYDSEGTSSIQTSDGKTSSLSQGSTIVIAGNTIKNAEGYQPPNNNPGPGVNTQVQIEEGANDISPVR